MAFTVVMLRNRSTIDGIAALHILETAIGRTLKIEFVNQTSPLSDDALDVLSAQGVFPIGIGSGRSYRDWEINGKKFGSETAIIIHELRSVRKISVEDKTLDDFAQMMSRNNNDGYLRRQPYSVNWIVLQGYRLGHDASEVNFTFTDEEVVRRGAHVVETYLRCLSEGEMDLGRRRQAMDAPAMHYLLPEKAMKHQGPMTVSRYIRDMSILGLDEAEIFEKAKWFVCVHDRAKERQIAAEKVAKTQMFDTFPLLGYKERGTWVDGDDPYLLEVLVRQKDLALMRSSKGNVIAMSKKFDLSNVASLLHHAQDEASLWHYEAGRNILANGTESAEVDPTKLSRERLKEVVSGCVVYK